MAKGLHLIDLDVDKLFENRTIEEIIEVQKLLDGEIGKKRIDLRCMVGDRYRDVLNASDAIKWMQTISEQTVDSIQDIIDRCEDLVKNSATSSKTYKPVIVDPQKVEERTIVMQIRLVIILNEEIFKCLDKGEVSTAAQFYLLAQHIHTGLRLIRKELLEDIPFLLRIKTTLEMLKSAILENITSKLESVQLNTQDTCNNLNALMLLESQNTNDLFNKFITLRITALNSVINESNISVRTKICELIKGLISTVHMLHDCFLSDLKNCKIWIEIDKIISETSPTTLSLITLPETPLIVYIPEIIKKFRPKCLNSTKLSTNESENQIKSWLSSIQSSINEGIVKSLELVNNVKGLYIIREEAFEIELPVNWNIMCEQIGLPVLSNLWNYLLQDLVTSRAEFLITHKISSYNEDILKEIKLSLKELELNCNSHTQFSVWSEELIDLSREINQHKGLSMKTKGFSPEIVKLCDKLDTKYLELLIDISLYLNGQEYLNESTNGSITQIVESKLNKFIDRQRLENHLKVQCKLNTSNLLRKLEEELQSQNVKKFVEKSILCARMVNGLTVLCPNFKSCCNCNATNVEWTEICNELNEYTLKFWNVCIEKSCNTTDNLCNDLYANIDSMKMIHLLPKWDIIDIQEQTEDNVFKSQIKVPMKTSQMLHNILTVLCDYLTGLLPHTFPKQIHHKFIEQNVLIILKKYDTISTDELNQTRALQFLFDVKFLTTFCVPRENIKVMQKSQEICDKFRGKVDPFDLDVFYNYIQKNVKQAVLQSQVIFGSLLPSANQLSSLGQLEKNTEHEKSPSILALASSTTSWFPLLPITAPLPKTTAISTTQPKDNEMSSSISSTISSTSRKAVDASATVRAGAAALFGAMTNDWFL